MDFDKELEKQRIATDSQEEEAVMQCSRCGTDIYAGENFWETEIGIMCECCYDDLFYQYKKDNKNIAGKDNEL